MNPIIEAKNITKTFGGQQILKGISLSIKEGEDLAIIGESGSGKSTLLHILGCIDKPTTGEVLVNGQKQMKCLKANWQTFAIAISDSYSNSFIWNRI